MENITHIFCGLCNKRLKAVIYEDSYIAYTCIVCGNSDDIENIIKIVGEGTHEQLAAFLKERIKAAVGS